MLRNRTDGVCVADRVGDRVLLDRVVNRLCEIERTSGLEKTLAIGRLILTQFFGGDPAIWQDRRRNKNNSIRRLAARADCPLSRSALNEAVAVYVASEELGCVLTSGHITSSHIVAVLTLPTPERASMLRSAEERHLSVKQLKAEVVARRRTDGERRGRPSRGSGQRLVSLLRRAVEQLRQAVTKLDLELPNPTVQTELEELATEVLAVAADLRSALQPNRKSSLQLRAAPRRCAPVGGKEADGS